MQYVGLLDCNNFFVSCERLFRPDLQRVPVVVLSSNDGCVVARSQEIKDKGISMGVPYFQVKDTLQEMGAVVFSSHFSLYRDVSRRVFAVLSNEVDIMEQYSIDEAFFIYSGDSPEEYATTLKRQIEQWVGIPVSIGLSANKTLAKWASAQAKSGSGVAVYDSAAVRACAASIPLHTIWGVGAKRAAAFRQHGLETVSDLCDADTERVAQLFGVEGVRLQSECSGDLIAAVSSKRAPQQSVTSSRSFRRSTTDRAVVEDALSYHLRRVSEDLRSQKQVAGTLQVSLQPSRHGSFALQGGRSHVDLLLPTADTFTLLKESLSLLDRMWKDGVPYQKVGVTLSSLQPEDTVSGTLFDSTAPDEHLELLSVLDDLNNRYGQETLRLGSVRKDASWQAKRDRLSPAYTTKWTDIAVCTAQ